MRRQLELFFTALGFFTRIPVPVWVPYSPERLNHAACYFPLVGWVVAAAGATSYVVFTQVLPASLAILLSMAVTIRLTGAFHEDGWADTWDGLGGGWESTQVLAIMKDSRIGTYGTVALVLMLLAKAAALIELAAHGTNAVVLALCIAHPLSRFASATLIRTLNYVREDASARAKPLAHRLQRGELLIAAAFGMLPLLLLTPLAALSALTAATLVTLWAARYFMHRIGGYTGDCLGAVQQGSELACYLGILIAWNYT